MFFLSPPSISKIRDIDGFELWYQPAYDYRTGHVQHNEVLLRWRDSIGRVLRPKQFMPWVSQDSMELALDRLVIHKAIQQIQAIPEASLSINLSEQSIRDTSFPLFVASEIERYRISPTRLKFEISEFQAAHNYPDVLEFIQEIKSIGCSVVLDNFSNDYLTFIQWERLNVDLVKIDGLMMSGSLSEQARFLLAQSITDASAQMGLVSVAKSMTESFSSRFYEQCQFDSAQGYQFKPPSQKICLTSKVDILGVHLDNWMHQDLIEQLDSGIVFTPNVDHLMNIRKDPAYRKAYSIADYKLCNSQVLYFASHFLGAPIHEKITAGDFFPAFCKYHQDNPEMRIFILGHDQHHVALAQENINQKIGREIVVDTCSPSPHFFDNEVESQAIIHQIKSSNASVLAVGIQSPEQEKWIYRYRSQLKEIKLIFALGDAIDIEAGVTKRAPEQLSNLGLEWLYHLLKQPHHLWKRYLINDLPFLWLLFKQKLSSESKTF